MITPKAKHIVIYWLPPIFWAAVIFCFSSIPVARTTEIYWKDFIVKKTAHVVEFGIFTLLLFRGFYGSKVNRRNAIIASVIFAMMYGMSDEFHQSFTPGREPTVRDVIFDTIGASLSAYFIWKYLPNLPPKLKNLASALRLV